MQKSLRFALAAAFILAGCKDLDEFSTRPNESYCGKIVTAPIVKLGFLDDVCMRMTFDTHHTADSPGAIWTNDGMFVATPLRALPQLSNDPLLLFTFGDGREKNFIFAADPVDPARGSSVMAVVSLMHSGGAEVRLLRGADRGNKDPISPDAGTPGDPALFGVFSPLERRSGSCVDQPGCTWISE